MEPGLILLMDFDGQCAHEVVNVVVNGQEDPSFHGGPPFLSPRTDAAKLPSVNEWVPGVVLREIAPSSGCQELAKSLDTANTVINHRSVDHSTETIA